MVEQLFILLLTWHKIIQPITWYVTIASHDIGIRCRKNIKKPLNFFQCNNSKMAETVIMKSYDRKNDPIFEYIEKHSLRLVNLNFNPFTVNLKKKTIFSKLIL